MGSSAGRCRATTALHGRALGRYRPGRAAAHHPKTQTAGHAARHGDGDHNYHTDDYDFRTSARRHKMGWTHSGPFAGCATMKLTHRFAEMTPDKRPQDPHLCTCRRHYPDAASEHIASLMASRRISLPR